MCQTCKCKSNQNSETTPIPTLVFALRAGENRVKRLLNKCYELPAQKGIEMLTELEQLQILIKSIRSDLEGRE